MIPSDFPISRTIDVKGQVCPYPIIRTREELNKLEKGQVLLVVTDNPPTAEETLPRLCQTKQYQLEVLKKEDGWYCYIRK